MPAFDVTPGEAIRYLAETDEQEAQARTQMEYFDHKIKEAKAEAYLKAVGSVDERKSTAEIDATVIELKEYYMAEMTIQRKLYNERKTCELIIAMWQTKSANSRRGNIT